MKTFKKNEGGPGISVSDKADFTSLQIANVTWTENVKMNYFCNIPFFYNCFEKK